MRTYIFTLAQNSEFRRKTRFNWRFFRSLIEIC